MTTVTKQVHFTYNRRRKRIVDGSASDEAKPAGRIPRVAKLMALAIRFDELLRTGKVRDMSELARLAHVTQPRMTQIMNLLHLAPDIQEHILHLPRICSGRDQLTEKDLRLVVAKIPWHEQRIAYKDQTLMDFTPIPSP